MHKTLLLFVCIFAASFLTAANTHPLRTDVFFDRVDRFGAQFHGQTITNNWYVDGQSGYMGNLGWFDTIVHGAKAGLHQFAAFTGLTILKKLGHHYFPHIFHDQETINLNTQIKKTVASLAADDNLHKLKLNDELIMQHQAQIAFLEKNAKTADDQKRLETEKAQYAQMVTLQAQAKLQHLQKFVKV
ncbi:MAG TPA: hypothetical protein VFF04_06620 [Candidatus Babeliales bacterium]|nr:hypothetical protein [Candidatus Babeliales bacterium]